MSLNILHPRVNRFQCRIGMSVISTVMGNVTTANTVQVVDTFTNRDIPIPDGEDPTEYCRELNKIDEDRALYLKLINEYTR